MTHPVYPGGCPLPIRDGEYSKDSNHTKYTEVMKIMGSGAAGYRFNTEESAMRTLANNAFKMTLPFDKSQSFSAVGIRVPTKAHREFDRVAIVDLEAFVPLLRAGLPLTWKLGQGEHVSVKLTWRTPQGMRRTDMPLARLLFNATEGRYCRYVWSPLLLTKSAWFQSRGKKGENARYDPMTSLRLHHARLQQEKGSGYLNFRDISKYLVPPEKINTQYFVTSSALK